MAKSLYKTLQVSENANKSDIKKAYKTMAKKYHPDLNKDTGAEDTFKEINAAYEVLSDPQKKSQYDQLGDSMFGGQNFHDFSQSSTHNGTDLNDIINQMFGGGGGGRRQGGFESMFGGGGGFSTQQQSVDLDVNIKITIPFDLSILGGVRTIQTQNNTFDIKIPAGINNHSKLRAKGKGNFHPQIGSGDMYIEIVISDSDEYTRDGYDLEKEVNVSLKQALFGDKIEIKTMYKTINLKIPQNTKQGQNFRLKEYGVLNHKTKEKGYLYVKVNIVNPKIEDLDENLVNMLKTNLPD